MNKALITRIILLLRQNRFTKLLPVFKREFQKNYIGKNHAKYFDENGWFYFTKEVFDLLYPSYGDTYPTYNGGVGMTYEQGGGGRAGLGIITSIGDTLTLKDRIAHHHTHRFIYHRGGFKKYN